MNVARELAGFPLLDALPWPAILLDATGTITHINQAMSDRDLQARELIGQRLPDALPEYHAALNGDPSWLRMQDADVTRSINGGLVHEHLWLRRVADGACLIIVDETRHRDIEARAAQSAQTARLASLGFMLAGACHEVSNPLAAAHSMVQLLQADPGASKEALRRGLANIGHNVRRVLDISRRLNNFSRVGEEEWRCIRIDWAVEEALMCLRQDQAFGSIIVEHSANAHATVLGSLGQLQQLFFNIFLNAAQAMQGSGQLGISLRCVDPALVEVTVQDTGPGIEPRHLPRLFEAFYTTKPSGMGTGLGLAISNEIAHEHGGTIVAQNCSGGGAMFLIRLPLQQRPA